MNLKIPIVIDQSTRSSFNLRELAGLIVAFYPGPYGYAPAGLLSLLKTVACD